MSVPPVLKAVRSLHYFPLYPPAMKLIAHTEKQSCMFESLHRRSEDTKKLFFMSLFQHEVKVVYEYVYNVYNSVCQKKVVTGALQINPTSFSNTTHLG